MPDEPVASTATSVGAGSPVAPAPPTASTPAAEPTRAAPDSAYVADLERKLAQSEAFNAQARTDYEAIAPYREHFVRYIQDEDERKFIDESRKAYEQLKTARQPELPPELRPLADDVKDVKTFISDFQKENKERAEAAQRERGQREWDVVRKLQSDHPWLAEAREINGSRIENAGAWDVVNWAQVNNLGNADFQTAFDAYVGQMRSRFGVESAPEPPPRSLRADAGVPGIPGPKPPGPIKGPEDIRKRLLASLKNDRAARSRISA